MPLTDVEHARAEVARWQAQENIALEAMRLLSKERRALEIKTSAPFPATAAELVERAKELDQLEAAARRVASVQEWCNQHLTLARKQLAGAQDVERQIANLEIERDPVIRELDREFTKVLGSFDPAKMTKLDEIRQKMNRRRAELVAVAK